MHPLDKVFETKKRNILSVYFTAGYPHPDSTVSMLELLDRHGADIIEVGIPFSDPLADGPVIQQSSQSALSQGINIRRIFRQLRQAHVQAPVVLMGYLNPVLQYGFEAFLRDAQQAGVSALILPDLPPEIFAARYQALYQKYGIYPVFLVSPQSSDHRIRLLDSLSKGFIYAVAASSTTGNKRRFGTEEEDWFNRLISLSLKNPVMAGFGIADHQSLQFVFDRLPGAVVGSALIRNLNPEKSDYGIADFMHKLLTPTT